MFSVKNVRSGNLFILNMIYGVSMSLGSIIGGIINKFMNDKLVFVLGLLLILIANILSNLIILDLPSLII